MKKNSILLFLFLCPFPAFCQHSYKQDLSHIATIIFPDTPKVKEVKSSDFYSEASGGKIYIAETTTIKKRFTDIFTSHLTDSVYRELVNVSLKIAGGTILYKRNIDKNGLSGVEFAYTAQPGTKIFYRYHQAFYFNNRLILYGCWSPGPLSIGDKDLKAFFGSFMPQIKKSDIRQDNKPAFVAYLGYGIGFLLFLVIVGFMVFGVVFIAKKLSRK